MDEKPNWTAAVSALECLVAMKSLEVARVSIVLFIGAMIMCSSIVDHSSEIPE